MLCTPAGGTRTPLSAQVLAEGRHFAMMDGKAVFKFASSVVVKTVEAALAKLELTVSDIRLFVPHQANQRITNLAAEKLKLRPDQVGANIERYGNTSAA